MIPPEPQTTIVIPVPEAEPLVAVWRARYDPSAAAGVPAHVTLLYPFLSPETVDEVVVSEVRSLVAGPRFEFKLSRTDWLGREGVRILHLVPEPSDPFSRLTARLRARFPACVPYFGFFGEAPPHLSVAHGSAEPPGNLEDALESALPVACTATEVWLMEKPRDGRWALREGFPLGAS